jgi:hypothetical protein
MRRRAAELEREMNAELERVRRSLRGEIVPYGAYETEMHRDDSVSIPIERPKRRRASG